MAGEKTYLNNIDNDDLVNLKEGSTGILSGGILSVGAGGPGVATTFDISDGNGQIVTELGVKTSVSWTGLIGESPIFLGQVITFVAVNNLGAVITQQTPFATAQSRSLIILGVIVHVNNVNVDVVNNEQHISYNVMSSVYDAMESIGFFNVTGNVFSANGANLTINKSLGSLFKMGSNYDTDVNNPHVKTNAATLGGIFQYRFSDGSSGILTETNIDPDNLDNGAGGLTPVGNNQWSIQRIYVFTSNNIKIQRGVSDYASSDAAINGIPTEAYVTEPSIADNGLFRGWLIIKKAATVLNGTDAIFLSAGKFGESGGSVGSGSTTTLQSSYTNSLANPEILTDATGGALSLRRGSVADTDDVFEVQNGAGTQTFSVAGDGKVEGTDFNGVALTTAGAATNYLNEQGSYTNPGGGSSPLTTKGDLYTYDTADQRLAIGTDNQRLIADSAEATGLKWITDGGHVGLGIEGIVTTGAAVSGFTIASAVSTNEMVYFIDGANPSGSNTKRVYKQFSVPQDYKSGGTIYIDTARIGTPVTWTMTAYVDDVIDSTINALSIVPTANLTFELRSGAFGATLVGGESISLQLDFEGGNAQDVEVRGIFFEYNR